MQVSELSLVSILVAILATCQPVASNDGVGFFLDNKTFRIRSSITRTSLDEPTSSSSFSLDEFYSESRNGQGRAKIQFENQARGQEAVYYDSTNRWPLLFKREQSTCEPIIRKDLIDILFSGSQVMGDFMAKIRSEQTHFIGPIRLLSYLATKTDDMTEFDTRSVPELRNHNTTGLKLKLPSNVTIYLFYDRVTFRDKETTCRSRIPLRLSLRFVEEDEFISIDYKELELERDLWASKVLMRGDFLAKINDELALPVGFNCSRTLPKVDLFESMELHNTRLSFVAISLDGVGYRTAKHFVVFDGLGQSMRIDMEESIELETNLKVTSKSFKLLDFASNKLYTIVADSATNHDDIQTQLEPKILRRTNNKCASTWALPPVDVAVGKSKGTLSQLSLGRLLFGAENFGHMGQARIRGIDVEVYEAHADKNLAFWFHQPAVAKDSRGEFRLSGQDGSLPYNVVVYLTGERRRKLLALEVFEQGYSSPIMSINFFDFIWDLSGSPEGDKIGDLFDHQDACLGSVQDGHGSNKYAEVSLDLVAYYSSNKTDWLNDMPQRELAIKAGMRRVFDQHGFMLYDFESKITKTDSTRQIQISFHTVWQPDSAFNLTFLGHGRPRYDQGVMPLQTSARSPVDCFWLLNQLESKPQSFYVLFDEHHCVTEADALIINEKTLNKSRIFELDEYYPGEIYRVDWNPTNLESSVSDELMKGKLSRFEGKTVPLQIPREELRGVSDTLTFRISSINVHSVNHLLSASDNYQGVLASVFPGYTLIEGQPGTWPFVSTELPAKRSLSLDLCQAACLVDANCKSFSYCSGWPLTTCQLSKFALNSPQVSSMLSVPEMSRLSRGSRLELAFDGEQVSLARDSRCELHHKLYSSLFERDWSTYVTLADQRVFRVDNEDQCAERCFGRTLDALEASDELGEQVGAELQDSGLPEQVRRSCASQERLKRSFCDRFYYLQGSLNEKQSRLVESRVDADETSANKSAYCFITDLDCDRTLPGAGKDEDLTSIFKLDVYRFDTIHLYERQPGILLMESANKTKEEFEAQQAMRKDPSQTATKILQQAFDAGKNLKLMIRSEDPSSCARLCLFQAAGLYPACQSFDFSVASPGFCQLNTMSVDSLPSNGADQNENVANTIHTNHFEPRFGLVKRRVKIDAAQWSLPFLDCISHSGENWTGKLPTLIVCLAAIASGLIIGSLLTERHLRRRSSRSSSLSDAGIVESLEDS